MPQSIKLQLGEAKPMVQWSSKSYAKLGPIDSSDIVARERWQNLSQSWGPFPTAERPPTEINRCNVVGLSILRALLSRTTKVQLVSTSDCKLEL